LISFRYHIVSIMAVFLALGLGILLGSSVVSAPLAERLEPQIERYKNERDDWRDKAEERASELNTLKRRLSSEAAPWALHNRLEARSFVLIIDRPQTPDWREHVLDALVAAGAQSQGTITLTARWALERADDEADLLSAVRNVVPSFEPGADVAASALELLGERFTESSGRALIDELAKAGFLTAQGPPDKDWPRPDSAVVLLSPSQPKGSTPLSGVKDFAASVSLIAPALAVTDSVEGQSAVTMLRDENELPKMLATFDSATNDADPGGIGVAAALLAATEARGGHFGAGRGLSFVAPPGPAL
jgi:hypothetical protein